VPDEFRSDETLLTSHETSSFSLLVTSAKLMIFNVMKLSIKLLLKLGGASTKSRRPTSQAEELDAPRSKFYDGKFPEGGVLESQFRTGARPSWNETSPVREVDVLERNSPRRIGRRSSKDLLQLLPRCYRRD